MVVKVQQSIFTTSQRRRVFVYNKARTIVFEGDLEDDIARKIGDDLKSFWHAHVDKQKQIVLGKKAEWRDW